MQLTGGMPHNTELRRIEAGVAFLTGIECPYPCSAEDQQRLISHDLVPLAGGSGPGSLYFTTDAAEHGTDVVPSAFATVPDAVIDTSLRASTGVDGWTPVQASIQLHDFGVGVAVVTWEPTRALGVDDAKDTAVIERLAHETEEIVRPLLDGSMDRLKACFPGTPRRDGVVSLLKSVEDQLPAFGRTLWVWSHLRMTVPAGVEHRIIGEQVASHVCPNDYTVLTHRDHTYATGVSVSVTCSSAGQFDDGVTLSRILPRQDAWWALVWALDRALLALQQDLDGASTTGSIASMVSRAQQIETVTARVQLLRSRIDSVLVNAGARDLAVWQSLAASWHLDLRIEVAQRKLLFLQNSYQSVLRETSRRRADQVSLMVYIFTAVSVIASAVAVVQYAQGAEAAGTTSRAMVLGICVLAAIAAVASTLRARRLREDKS